MGAIIFVFEGQKFFINLKLDLATLVEHQRKLYLSFWFLLIVKRVIVRALNLNTTGVLSSSILRILNHLLACLL